MSAEVPEPRPQSPPTGAVKSTTRRESILTPEQQRLRDERRASLFEAVQERIENIRRASQASVTGAAPGSPSPTGKEGEGRRDSMPGKMMDEESDDEAEDTKEPHLDQKFAFIGRSTTGKITPLGRTLQARGLLQQNVKTIMEEEGVKKKEEAKELAEALEKISPDRLRHVINILKNKAPQYRSREDIDLLSAVLKSNKFFRALDAKTRNMVCKDIDYYPVPADHTLFHQGDDGDAFYLILSGEVGIYTEKAKKKKRGGRASITAGSPTAPPPSPEKPKQSVSRPAPPVSQASKTVITQNSEEDEVSGGEENEKEKQKEAEKEKEKEKEKEGEESPSQAPQEEGEQAQEQQPQTDTPVTKSPEQAPPVSQASQSKLEAPPASPPPQRKTLAPPAAAKPAAPVLQRLPLQEMNHVATLGEGDSFGEWALVRNEKRMATVHTLTPCQLLVIEKAFYQEVLQAARVLQVKLAAFVQILKTKPVSDRTSEDLAILAEFLRSVPMFANIPEEALRVVATMVDIRSYAAFSEIVKEGDMPDLVFGVVNGSCGVYQEIKYVINAEEDGGDDSNGQQQGKGQNGAQQGNERDRQGSIIKRGGDLGVDDEGDEIIAVLEHVCELEEGDVFGEWGLALDTPRMASVVSLQFTSVFVLDKITYRRFVRPERQDVISYDIALEILRTRAPQRRDKTEIAMLDRLLKQSELFAALERGHRHALCRQLRLKNVNAGMILARQGQLHRTFVMILRGQVHVLKKGGNMLEWLKRARWRTVVRWAAAETVRRELLETETEDWVAFLADILNGKRTVALHPYLPRLRYCYQIAGMEVERADPVYRENREGSLFALGRCKELMPHDIAISLQDPRPVGPIPSLHALHWSPFGKRGMSRVPLGISSPPPMERDESGSVEKSQRLSRAPTSPVRSSTARSGLNITLRPHGGSSAQRARSCPLPLPSQAKRRFHPHVQKMISENDHHKYRSPCSSSLSSSASSAKPETSRIVTTEVDKDLPAEFEVDKPEPVTLPPPALATAVSNVSMGDEVLPADLSPAEEARESPSANTLPHPGLPPRRRSSLCAELNRRRSLTRSQTSPTKASPERLNIPMEDLGPEDASPHCQEEEGEESEEEGLIPGRRRKSVTMAPFRSQTTMDLEKPALGLARGPSKLSSKGSSQDRDLPLNDRLRNILEAPGKKVVELVVTPAVQRLHHMKRRSASMTTRGSYRMAAGKGGRRYSQRGISSPLISPAAGFRSPVKLGLVDLQHTPPPGKKEVLRLMHMLQEEWSGGRPLAPSSLHETIRRGVIAALKSWWSSYGDMLARMRREKTFAHLSGTISELSSSAVSEPLEPKEPPSPPPEKEDGETVEQKEEGEQKDGALPKEEKDKEKTSKPTPAEVIALRRVEKGVPTRHQRMRLTTLRIGAHFGDWFLVHPVKRSYSLVAANPVSLLMLSAKRFQMAVAESTAVFTAKHEEAINILRETPMEARVVDHLQVIDALVCTQQDLAALPTKMRMELARLCHYNKRKRGETLFKEGANLDAFFLLLSGAVDVFIHNMGKDPVARIKKGACFGEEAFQDGFFTRKCTVKVAEAQVEFLSLTRDDYRRIDKQYRQLNVHKQKAAQVLKWKDPGTRTPQEIETLLSVLKPTALFQQLNPDLRKEVCQKASYKVVPAMTIVFNQGDEPDNFYMILKGSVTVWKQKENARGAAETRQSMAASKAVALPGQLLERTRRSSIQRAERRESVDAQTQQKVAFQGMPSGARSRKKSDFVDEQIEKASNALGKGGLPSWDLVLSLAQERVEIQKELQRLRFEIEDPRVTEISMSPLLASLRSFTDVCSKTARVRKLENQIQRLSAVLEQAESSKAKEEKEKQAGRGTPGKRDGTPAGESAVTFGEEAKRPNASREGDRQGTPDQVPQEGEEESGGAKKGRQQGPKKSIFKKDEDPLVAAKFMWLNELREGQSFGDAALISKDRRNATIRTVGETEFLIIDKDSFDSIIKEDIHRQRRLDIQFLKTWLPGARSQSDSTVERVMPYYFKRESFVKGTILYEEGKQSDKLFIIISGQVKLLKMKPVGPGCMAVRGRPSSRQDGQAHAGDTQGANAGGSPTAGAAAANPPVGVPTEDEGTLQAAWNDRAILPHGTALSKWLNLHRVSKGVEVARVYVGHTLGCSATFFQLPTEKLTPTEQAAMLEAFTAVVVSPVAEVWTLDRDNVSRLPRSIIDATREAAMNQWSFREVQTEETLKALKDSDIRLPIRRSRECPCKGVCPDGSEWQGEDSAEGFGSGAEKREGTKRGRLEMRKLLDSPFLSGKRRWLSNDPFFNQLQTFFPKWIPPDDEIFHALVRLDTLRGLRLCPMPETPGEGGEEEEPRGGTAEAVSDLVLSHGLQVSAERRAGRSGLGGKFQGDPGTGGLAGWDRSDPQGGEGETGAFTPQRNSNGYISPQAHGREDKNAPLSSTRLLKQRFSDGMPSLVKGGPAADVLAILANAGGGVNGGGGAGSGRVIRKAAPTGERSEPMPTLVEGLSLQQKSRLRRTAGGKLAATLLSAGEEASVQGEDVPVKVSNSVANWLLATLPSAVGGKLDEEVGIGSKEAQAEKQKALKALLESLRGDQTVHASMSFALDRITLNKPHGAAVRLKAARSLQVTPALVRLIAAKDLDAASLMEVLKEDGTVAEWVGALEDQIEHEVRVDEFLRAANLFFNAHAPLFLKGVPVHPPSLSIPHLDCLKDNVHTSSNSAAKGVITQRNLLEGVFADQVPQGPLPSLAQISHDLSSAIRKKRSANGRSLTSQQTEAVIYGNQFGGKGSGGKGKGSALRRTAHQALIQQQQQQPRPPHEPGYGYNADEYAVHREDLARAAGAMITHPSRRLFFCPLINKPQRVSVESILLTRQEDEELTSAFMPLESTNAGDSAVGDAKGCKGKPSKAVFQGPFGRTFRLRTVRQPSNSVYSCLFDVDLSAQERAREREKESKAVRHGRHAEVPQIDRRFFEGRLPEYFARKVQTLREAKEAEKQAGEKNSPQATAKPRRSGSRPASSQRPPESAAGLQNLLATAGPRRFSRQSFRLSAPSLPDLSGQAELWGSTVAAASSGVRDSGGGMMQDSPSKLLLPFPENGMGGGTPGLSGLSPMTKEREKGGAKSSAAERPWEEFVLSRRSFPDGALASIHQRYLLQVQQSLQQHDRQYGEREDEDEGEEPSIWVNDGASPSHAASPLRLPNRPNISLIGGASPSPRLHLDDHEQSPRLAASLGIKGTTAPFSIAPSPCRPAPLSPLSRIHPSLQTSKPEETPDRSRVLGDSQVVLPSMQEEEGLPSGDSRRSVGPLEAEGREEEAAEAAAGLGGDTETGRLLRAVGGIVSGLLEDGERPEGTFHGGRHSFSSRGRVPSPTTGVSSGLNTQVEWRAGDAGEGQREGQAAAGAGEEERERARDRVVARERARVRARSAGPWPTAPPPEGDEPAGVRLEEFKGCEAAAAVLSAVGDLQPKLFSSGPNRAATVAPPVSLKETDVTLQTYNTLAAMQVRNGGEGEGRREKERERGKDFMVTGREMKPE
uniref:Cyclic nucleotide-binding domain-containing protein n=1 Tax=Chromera velia CCMP2878 TaxID=1169474 RepID=A0A0G4G2G2_9ALVE|eukprot:Cvel_4094.t1-p1 / transcript=Cvel_4094.t1 / gene=Cvel_4094 / organism=Chromera_velia_CCMP2878 / gene_product=hypothetical protein / transcript_product=hypothetical protein / location=Cvel_scaffold174:59155-78227(+) / protein_length=3525 / sequence_SO=supercontig / SO=protein_coding / is_pseudo=false